MSPLSDSAPRAGGRLDVAMVALALLASLALIWLVTGEAVAVAAFAAGLVGLGALVLVLCRGRPAAAEQEASLPDWTVTAAAITLEDVGLAITDRANRLVCANPAYERWFGAVQAPLSLPLAHEALGALNAAARVAWRDGSARIEELTVEQDRWQVDASRAGRAEDYLVWRFTAISQGDPASDMAAQIGGSLGALLGRAGIDSVLVGPEGAIRAASAGFARRAAGDAGATMAGQDFVGLLRSDDAGRIYFAREGRKGAPQTLVHVSLADPADPDPAAPDVAPSLMLLLDAGVGIGGGVEPVVQAGAPQLEALLGQLPLGLAMADRDGRFLFANPAFLRAAGIENGKLAPYPADLVIKEDKGALVEAVRRFGQGPASSGDMAVRLRANPDEPVSLGLAGVRGLGDAAVLLSLADTTEETRLKRQVAQATKMQAVGQLAGGVAHDFNNVLTAIIGYCDLMLLRHTPGDSDYDDIQQIRANSNRAASLTRQLLAFSRQQTLRPEVLQLPDVVSEVSQLLKRLMGEKIEFKVNHARGLGPVRADPQQLEQVIVNLAVNARDAMLARARQGVGASASDGGFRLSLSTRPVSADQVRRMKSEIIPIGDYTALVVEDTGGGIPPQFLGKIFEPFFTTKEMGRSGSMGGTGLGLSTVYGIVKQSGGFIFADNIASEEGRVRGARFTVYLPVHHGDVPKIVARAETVSAWSGGGRILLVEDEDMVRAVAERALARQGYTITTASDGEEGLELVCGGAEFDLVVSDVVMPGMDGPAMAREIRQRVPGLPVLFMSGYAEEQLRAEIDIENMHFIPKPFSVQQIADKVAEVLAASAG